MWSNGEAQTEILGKNLSSSTLSAMSPTRTRLRVNMGSDKPSAGFMAGNGHLNYVFNEEDFQEENLYKRNKLNV
jgi:hypothetical protein